MAEQTIHIPPELVDRVRRSLLHVYAGIAEAASLAAANMAVAGSSQDDVRGHRVELADAADALDQIGWEIGATVEVLTLSAHPELLSDGLRQSLHDCAEAFENTIDQAAEADGHVGAARLVLADVSALLELYAQVLGEES